MWLTETVIEVDAGHWLRLPYRSPCNEQHGHRWKVVVKCRAEALDDNGMVIDFAAVKSIVRELDHTVMNKAEPFTRINPTAENLAQYWCRRINEYCRDLAHRPSCYEVVVEETPANRAVFLLP